MDAQSQWTGLDARRLARVGEHLERNYVEPGRIAGCQVSVARHGHIAYAKAFGLSDRERQKPVRSDAIWRIYSMTKPITSVALMMLYERGMFQLDEPVARYAPSWTGHRVWLSGPGEEMVLEPAQRPVSFRDLLRHTAGFTYAGRLGPDTQHPTDPSYREQGLGQPGARDSMEGFLGKLGRVTLAYQPGSAWMYSLATDACGALVEVISGKPFASFLAEEIFAPLGMTDTAFQVAPDKFERLSANYRHEADGSPTLVDDAGDSVYAREPGFKSGGGGLVSTTADYLRFCDMLRRGGELDGARILGPRTLDLMHMNHLPGGKDLARASPPADMAQNPPGVGFGLGFAVNLGQVQSGGYGSGDYYWGGAASTLFWVDPKEDLSVVFMTQLMGSPFDFHGELKSLVYSAIVD